MAGSLPLKNDVQLPQSRRQVRDVLSAAESICSSDFGLRSRMRSHDKTGNT